MDVLLIAQWRNRLAEVEKLQKYGDALQVSRSKTLSYEDRRKQVAFCRQQVLKGRVGLELLIDRMTEEEREAAGGWYEDHIDLNLSISKCN